MRRLSSALPTSGIGGSGGGVGSDRVEVSGFGSEEKNRGLQATVGSIDFG